MGRANHIKMKANHIKILGSRLKMKANHIKILGSRLKGLSKTTIKSIKDILL